MENDGFPWWLMVLGVLGSGMKVARSSVGLLNFYQNVIVSLVSWIFECKIVSGMLNVK